MKHWIWIICLAWVAVGCTANPEGQVLARVGAAVITKEDFDESYRSSSAAAQDTVQARKAFLEHLIDQKRILIDAQARGLDKDKGFLNMVESFWQQSLVTVALKTKSEEGTDLDQWMEYLRKNTPVKINEELLQ